MSPMSGRPLRVLHVIPRLATGGSEAVLTALVLGTMPGDGIEHQVLLFRPEGHFRDLLLDRGVEIHDLGSERARASKLIDTYHVIRAVNPDVIHSWVYQAGLISALVGRVIGAPSITAFHRLAERSSMDLESWLMVRLLCGPLQRLPDAFVACSSAAASSHRRLGLRRKITVIENGITTRYPTDDVRAASRSYFGIPPDVPSVGHAARWAPVKDHATFLRAIGQLRRRTDAFHVLMAGRGIDESNASLRALIEQSDLTDCVSLVGEVTDMSRFYSACDVVCSSSISEGFGNVVAESMAAGVPVVATAVGVTARIVGAHGWVVEPASPVALANALYEALTTDPPDLRARGQDARRWVDREFGERRMIERYVDLYRRVAGWTPKVAGTDSA